MAFINIHVYVYHADTLFLYALVYGAIDKIFTGTVVYKKMALVTNLPVCLKIIGGNVSGRTKLNDSVTFNQINGLHRYFIFK